MPSRPWPVWARIWVSPAAALGSLPAITSGRPALSTNTMPSSTAGSIPVPALRRSISGRNGATRWAVASAPPGLWVNSTWASPAIARLSNWASREGM